MKLLIDELQFTVLPTSEELETYYIHNTDILNIVSL